MSIISEPLLAYQAISVDWILSIIGGVRQACLSLVVGVDWRVIMMSRQTDTANISNH